MTVRAGRDLEQEEDQVGDQFGDVRGQDIGKELTDIVEHRAAFLDGGDDAREVVIGQDHVGGLASHVGAGHAHGDADIGPLQRRHVVDAVAGHRHDLPLPLQAR